jgi:hypothetical protein
MSSDVEADIDVLVGGNTTCDALRAPGEGRRRD